MSIRVDETTLTAVEMVEADVCRMFTLSPLKIRTVIVTIAPKAMMGALGLATDLRRIVASKLKTYPFNPLTRYEIYTRTIHSSNPF
jgi:hypothetical protein